MSEYRMTQKQLQIITAIHEHQKNHKQDIDLDQLLGSLPYETTKESMQFSLRALIKKGLLAKVGDAVIRRGRARRTYRLTLMAKEMFRLGSEKSHTPA